MSTSLLKYAKLDLEIFKNRDFSVQFQVLDNSKNAIDITNYDIASSIRVEQRLTSDLIVNFTVTKTDSINGKFTLSLTETETDLEETFGFYDILFDFNNSYDTYVFGMVNFLETSTSVPVSPFFQIIAPENIHAYLSDLDTSGHNANIIIANTTTFNGLLTSFSVSSTATTQELFNYIDIYSSGCLSEISACVSALATSISTNYATTNSLNGYATTHTHNSITLLNSLSATGGDLYYNGNQVGITDHTALNNLNTASYSHVDSTVSSLLAGYTIGQNLIYSNPTLYLVNNLGTTLANITISSTHNDLTGILGSTYGYHLNESYFNLVNSLSTSSTLLLFNGATLATEEYTQQNRLIQEYVSGAAQVDFPATQDDGNISPSVSVDVFYNGKLLSVNDYSISTGYIILNSGATVNDIITTYLLLNKNEVVDFTPYQPKIVEVLESVGGYTLSTGDNAKIVFATATIYVPANTLPIGFQCQIVNDKATDTLLRIQGDVSVTLTTAISSIVDVLWRRTVYVICKTTNEFYIDGGLY